MKVESWWPTSIFSFFKYRVPRLVQATTFCNNIYILKKNTHTLEKEYQKKNNVWNTIYHLTNMDYIHFVQLLLTWWSNVEPEQSSGDLMWQEQNDKMKMYHLLLQEPMKKIATVNIL